MIYIFRIRPVARFFFSILLGFVGWQLLTVSTHVHNATAIVPAVEGVIFIILGLFTLPQLGRILRAYLSTWKW